MFEVKGNPMLAMKVYHEPIPGYLAEFERLVSVGPSVKQRLSGTAVELAWPTGLIESDGDLAGCLMPKIQHWYEVEVARGRTVEASLDLALQHADGPDGKQPADAEALLGLAFAVGEFLDALHEHDYVFGDIAWDRFRYRLEPRPTIAVLGLDSVRRIGVAPVHEMVASTEGWEDPHPAPPGPDGLDQDRYRFALLAYRLLSAGHRDARLPHSGPIHWSPGLDERRTRRLTRLTERAAGGPLERPAVSEWLAALA